MANQKLKIINCSNLQIKALSQAYKLEGGDKSSSPHNHTSYHNMRAGREGEFWLHCSTLNQCQSLGGQSCVHPSAPVKNLVSALTIHF